MLPLDQPSPETAQSVARDILRDSQAREVGTAGQVADDNLPSDREWLLSIGFRDLQGRIECRILRWTASGIIAESMLSVIGTSGGVIWSVASNPTRGDVRKLIEALKIQGQT